MYFFFYQKKCSKRVKEKAKAGGTDEREESLSSVLPVSMSNNGAMRAGSLVVG